MRAWEPEHCRPESPEHSPGCRRNRRRRTERLHQYLSKGTKVAIEGKLRWSQWERDGQKRSAFALEFLQKNNFHGSPPFA